MKRLMIFLTIFFLKTGFGQAASVGPVLPLANQSGNQQNPIVLALPDRGFWFVAWEDWSNPLDANIKGAFVRLKELTLGEEECRAQGFTWYQGHCYQGLEVCNLFSISSDDGHQLSPSAAYDPDDEKIIVAWRDPTWPYLYYRAFTPPTSCEAPPTFFAIQPVPFNPTFDCTFCQGTCVCAKEISYENVCKSNNYFWNPCNDTCYRYQYSEPESEDECIDIGGTWCPGDGKCYGGNVSYQIACQENSEYSWNEEQIRCEKQQNIPYGGAWTCFEEFYLSLEEISYPSLSCNAEEFCREFCQDVFPGSEVVVNLSELYSAYAPLDSLLSRQYVQVVYNPRDRAFWFAWMEKRRGRTRITDSGCGFSGQLTTGEGLLPAYGKLNVTSGLDWNNLANQWELISELRTSDESIFASETRWIGFPKMARKLEVVETGTKAPPCPLQKVPTCEVSYKYELFVDTGRLSLTPNPNEGGVLLVWSGKRELAYMTFCSADFERGFATGVELDPEEKHVWTIHSDNVGIGGWPSQQVSSAGPVYHPRVAFDPVTNRYLVVWEDTRDVGPNAPKIYGQLLDGLSTGFYQTNFPLTLENQVGDLWPYLKETFPTIAWDPINQRFLVAWQDNRANTVSIENIDIWGQYVDPEGSLRGENFLISATERGQPTAGNQLAPEIAYDPQKGIYLAVWKDARNYSLTGSDIYAQAFSIGQPQLSILNEEKKPLHPTVLDFGTLRVGERKSLSFFLRNTGDSPLKLCEVSLLEGPFNYLLLPQILSDGNPTTCLEMEPGIEVEIIVEFTPPAEGTYSETIEIISNAGERTIILQGAVRPVISADRTSFDFGEVLIGNTRSFSFSLINHSEEEIEITKITLDPEEIFSIEGFSEGSKIGPSEALTGRLIFNPKAPEFYEGVALFVFSKGGSISFSLNGIGKESPLRITPAELDFGTLRTGSSQTLTFTIQNQGLESLVLTSIEELNPPFSLEGLPLGTLLPPGGTLSGTIIFSPGEKGFYEEEFNLLFKQGDENIRVSYSLRGRALELPACFFTNLPKRVMLHSGISPIWFFSVTGDDDLLLSRFQEPALMGYDFLINEPGNYLLALYPPHNLEPYFYRDRTSFLFAGAQNPIEIRSNLILSAPPLGWSFCLPELVLYLNGQKALRFKSGTLPRTLTLSLRLSWSCAPNGVYNGKAYLKVISPKGDTFYYDLSRGFVSYPKEYNVSPPITFHDEINILLPSSLEDGLWLFELALDAGGEHFYTQGGLIINGLPKAICQTVDLAD